MSRKTRLQSFDSSAPLTPNPISDTILRQFHTAPTITAALTKTFLNIVFPFPSQYSKLKFSKFLYRALSLPP
jgi:hypothetical protein